MKLHGFLCLVFLLPLLGVGQEENSLTALEDVMPRDTLFMAPNRMKLAIIPFEPKMYRSEIDRFIGENDGLTFQEIRGYFRLGLDNALSIECKKQYEVVRMHADNADVNRDLDYIYKSVGYQYRVMPPPPEPEAKGFKKFTKEFASSVKEAVDELKEDPPPPGGRIENGQVVHHAYTQERFMAIQLINQEMFNYLSDKYQTGLYLFINQLDMRHTPGQDYTMYGTGNFTREIKIHFSILTSDKKEIYAGAVKREFSGRQNSLKKIIVQNFPAMASEIVNRLPVVINNELTQYTD